MGTGSQDRRPLLLVIESNAIVRRILEAVGRDQLRFHFAESISDRLLARQWGLAVERPELALVEVPDTSLETLARLSRLHDANPSMRVVLTVCYDADYQLAAERLRDLSDRVVFRPFDAEPVVRTLVGLA